MLDHEGARIALADLDIEGACARARALSPERTLAMRLDVGDPDSVNHCVAQAVDHFGQLDAVVNNAGVDVTLPVEELQIADWDRVLRTNLTGPFLLSRAACPHLKEGGHIVNIVSTAARRAWPNASAYHASKWGLLGLSHALHAELRPRGVKVSALIAGGMRTPFLLDRFPDIDQGTLQEPANVAHAVRFLLTQPGATVVPEIMVLPMKETSWP
jgi:NAD(P)-dependent dehydrogenase (short-subunit alcohol dehydrogenase family)